uniref:Uncharacterized protein n=1 Tax=Oryza brachyantha TaxID=4533 RepID=J3L5N0_ORYBR
LSYLYSRTLYYIVIRHSTSILQKIYKHPNPRESGSYYTFLRTNTYNFHVFISTLHLIPMKGEGVRI